MPNDQTQMTNEIQMIECQKGSFSMPRGILALIAESQKWDGTVKSSKCKLSLAKSRLSKTPLAVRGLANLEDEA